MEIRVGCIVRIIRKFGSFPAGTVGCVAGLSVDGKSCVLAMWDELGNTCGRIECGVDSIDMLEEEDLVTLEKRIREGTDNLLKPDGEGILKGRAGVPIKFVKEDRDLIRTLVPSEGIDDSGEKVTFPIGSIGVAVGVFGIYPAVSCEIWDETNYPIDTPIFEFDQLEILDPEERAEIAKRSPYYDDDPSES